MNTQSPSLSRSRFRAGVLVVLLALVGGTGCITTAIVQSVRQKNQEREAERQHQQNLVRLPPLAEAGDPVASVALVRELLAYRASVPIDQGRILGLLSRAADKGYGPAQGRLGDILVKGRFSDYYPQVDLEPRYQNRERGIALLHQAAVQACTYNSAPDAGYGQSNWKYPAEDLASVFEREGRKDEAQLWQARSVMHCNRPALGYFYQLAISKYSKPQQRIDALTSLLLAGDAARVSQAEAARIAKAEAAAPAEEVDVARREAERLRSLVQQSEREYPAPAHQELP
jgi:hypothetical protein